MKPVSEDVYQLICAKIKEFCLYYDVMLVGTCGSEGITGEISVAQFDPDESEAFNFENCLD
jgi:hypothetical protein